MQEVLPVGINSYLPQVLINLVSSNFVRGNACGYSNFFISIQAITGNMLVHCDDNFKVFKSMRTA